MKCSVCGYIDGHPISCPVRKGWPDTIKELLALHEVFRKMGYKPEELYVVPYKTSGAIQFWLDHKGKCFVVDVASGEDTEKIVADWPKAAEWWNSKDTSDLERASIYKQSKLLRGGGIGSLVAALTLRGFTAPGILN